MTLTANQLNQTEIEETPTTTATTASLTARVLRRYPNFEDIAQAAGDLRLSIGNHARLQGGKELRVRRADRHELERRLDALDRDEDPYPKTHTLANGHLRRLI